MRLKIEHTTAYHYTAPIFPEPQHFYFYPHARPHLELISFDLQVAPTPAGLALRYDLENNAFYQSWFNQKADFLRINIEMEIETKPFKPLDFLVELKPKTGHQDALKLYLKSQVDLSNKLSSWTTGLKRQANGNPITFLSTLCAEIGMHWEHIISYKPELLDPNACFEARSGSCRDLSWMMIELLRNQNVPARFISGYSHNPDLKGHELHAWVEAGIPGAGWIGLDPSSGLFVTEHYVPVAASYHPANTLPVQGTFRGAAVSKLDTKVKILAL